MEDEPTAHASIFSQIRLIEGLAKFRAKDVIAERCLQRL